MTTCSRRCSAPSRAVRLGRSLVAPTLNREIAEYRQSGGGTLAARADDLADLRDRVLRAQHGSAPSPGQIPPGSILVAADLTPSAFSAWIGSGAGAVSLGGSPVSHVSILARARGINLVVGLNAKLDEIGQGRPRSSMRRRAFSLCIRAARPSHRRICGSTRTRGARRNGSAAAAPAATAGGEPVKIMVNIDEPDRLDALRLTSATASG